MSIRIKSSAKLSDEQRQNCIEIAAYYIAENRGLSGCDLENWQVAEAKIDRLLLEGKFQPQL